MLLKVTREEVLATFDGDLISALEERVAHADCAQDQEVAAWAIDEIKRCHARLEIDHYWVQRTDGEADEMHRVDIPFKDRSKVTDGIECRDTTIEILTPTPTEGEPK